jgi:tetratricopeptide (TPR) repeat protein
VLFVAGMLYRLDGLYEKALAMYDRLLELNPQDVVIVSFNRARIYTHEARFEEALADLEKALEVGAPPSAREDVPCATYYNAGDTEAAHACDRRRIARDPHFDGARPAARLVPVGGGPVTRRRSSQIPDRVRDVAPRTFDIAFWAGRVLRDVGACPTRLSSGSRPRSAWQRELTRTTRRAASSTRLRCDPLFEGSRGAEAPAGRRAWRLPKRPRR